MALQLSTKKLTGRHVIGGTKDKRIGKVRAFVFHPSERRVIGFIIRRPDAALMFHRKDMFAPLGSFVVESDGIHLTQAPSMANRSAVKPLGLHWDRCVLWIGMPLVTKGGKALGYAEDVRFNAETGEVLEVVAENGKANDVILGHTVIPASMIKGFNAAKRSVPSDPKAAEEAQMVPGVILVSDEAASLGYEGGVAAAAGKATALATDKARKGTALAKEKAAEAKPVVKKAASKADEVIQAGAYAAGKQLGRASGMFASFKEEFDRAMQEDDDERDQ